MYNRDNKNTVKIHNTNKIKQLTIDSTQNRGSVTVPGEGAGNGSVKVENCHCPQPGRTSLPSIPGNKSCKARNVIWHKVPLCWSQGKKLLGSSQGHSDFSQAGDYQQIIISTLLGMYLEKWSRRRTHATDSEAAGSFWVILRGGPS